jgi:Pregnancy-associated plasma protein-A/Secretion system C-terminal sorting domain
MKKLYIFLLLTIVVSQSFSQSNPIARWPKTPINNYRCFTDEVDAWRIQQIGANSRRTSFENWINNQLHQLQHPQAAERMTPIIYNIPVIFHIIHNGEAAGVGTNIAAAQVNAQIQQLNNDFRKIAGTSGYNAHAFGADVQIQFCAAAIDPTNNALGEAGIERINRNTKGWNAPPFTVNYLEATVKPNSIWDATKYLNIWVCNISGGILGYAQFPDAPNEPGNPASTAANTDGVVVLYNTVGSSLQKFPGSYPYDEGRTLTHEVGHWLGLRHIWGDGDCTTDDFVFDTPRASGPHFGCAAPTTNSCNDITYGSAVDSNDMVKNYMDYSDDACMNIYTIGQKDRMRVVMGETGNGSPRRAQLRLSDRCQSGPLVSFVLTDTTVLEKTDCNVNWSYTIPVRISGAPNAATTVSLALTSGGADGNDISISPSSVSFSATDLTDKYFYITVNSDAVMEGHEIANLNLNVSGSNATAAPDSFELVIMNDDWVPMNGKRTPAILLSEDFENTVSGWITNDYVAGNNKWLLGGTNASMNGSKSAYISKNNSALQYDANSTSGSLLYHEVDASLYDSLYLSLWYKCKGEKDANGIYDYGKIVYSTDSITFHQLNGTADLVDSSNMTYIAAPIPYFLWNRKFYIGFYWENDNGVGNDPSFAIDDITITGKRWMPSMIHTAVDTASGYDEKPVGPMETVNFYDKTTGDVLATIQDLGGWNWGCVRVEVDRAGNGAQWVTGDPQTTPQTMIFDRTYKVTPTNNNSNGQYQITFYLTQAEMLGWQLASTNPVNMARIIKYSDRINNMTYTSTFEQNNATWSSYLGGSDYQVSAQFSTGFSGFGFGRIPPSTLPVQLLSFTGSERNKMAELQWKAEGENNLSHYTVQRSRDGNDYEDIGTVAARGIPGILNYSFTDINPYNGRNYYRLTIQDHDGSKKLSNIIIVTISNKINFSIQPNPFNNKLTIAVNNASGQMIYANLTDMSGKMIVQKNTITSVNSVIQFDLPGLSAGIYYIKLNDGNNVQVFKVIKE